MSTTITIRDLIQSKAADDNTKGDLVFQRILEESKKSPDILILDFSGIELVNTAFLNNAIGQLYNRNVFDINKYNVRISNLQESMIDLLRESISVAYEKYA